MEEVKLIGMWPSPISYRVMWPSPIRNVCIIQTSFTNFVYRVLLLCKISHLHKFHLKCDRDYPVSHINAWVSAALSHDVQEIDINIRISRKKIGLLPCDLFTCQTLVVLKLSVHVLEVPTSVCLPNLKVLRLKGTEIKDDASFSRLLSSCPSLEDLALLACVSDNITGLNISAPTLKKLVLDNISVRATLLLKKLKNLQLNLLKGSLMFNFFICLPISQRLVCLNIILW